MKEKNAKSTALWLLSIKNRSLLELRKKLSLKGFSIEEVDEAIEACQRMGYLSDESEAKRRTERLARKGYGPQMIRLKLRQAGLDIPKEVNIDQVAQIKELLKKTTWKRKTESQKIAALQRRGFSGEAIREVICISEF